MTEWSSVRVVTGPTTDRHDMAQSEAPEAHPIHTMTSTTKRTIAFSFDCFRISVQLKVDFMILLQLEMGRNITGQASYEDQHEALQGGGGISEFYSQSPFL